MTDTLLSALAPHMMELLGLLVAAIIAAAAARFCAWTGIEIEARHRDALHRAIMSGLRAAMARRNGTTDALVIEEAIAHAQTSVPDALRALRPDPGTLQRIAAARLAEIIR
jgi:hypothetical protein